jgi:hypothetical protein
MNRCNYCEHALISTCSTGLHITCKKTNEDKSFSVVYTCGDYEDRILNQIRNQKHGEFFMEEEFAV